MVSALDSGSGDPGRAVDGVEFLGNTLYSHSASPHPVVEMGTREFTSGITLRLSSIPSRVVVGEGILLVASCYENWDKFRPDGPLGS